MHDIKIASRPAVSDEEFRMWWPPRFGAAAIRQAFEHVRAAPPIAPAPTHHIYTDIDSMAACLLAEERGLSFQHAKENIANDTPTSAMWRRLATRAIEHIPHLKGRYG